MPREMFSAWRNFLSFNLEHFSIPFLLRTFFNPWHRYKAANHKKGLDVGRFLETLFSNIIFCSLGALMRFFVIVYGLAVEVFIFAFGILAFLVWFFLPLILLALLFIGLKFLT
jgi:hypothetical protein